MRLVTAITAVVLLAVAAACGGDEQGVQPTTTTLPRVDVETEVPEASATTEHPAPTTAATAPEEDEGPPVVLRGDGLGAVRFGAPVDEVIVALTLRWGPPDSDTGWWDPKARGMQFAFGACPGNEQRGVEWRDFWVLFSDGPTPWGPAANRHFFSWYYDAEDYDAPRPDPGGNRPPLQTEVGISLGAAVADLQRAYGERLELFDAPEAGGPFFGVQTPNGGLNGGVTSVEPTGIVRRIIGGGGCGE